MSCIATIDLASPAWGDLPHRQREHIRTLAELFRQAPETGRTAWLHRQAGRLGIGASTIVRKYYALRDAGGDWTALIDTRVVTGARAAVSRTKLPAFRAELLRLAEAHQRKTTPAIRALKNRWQARREQIPGYEDWQGWPQIPAGWSQRNLARIIAAESNKARFRSIRVGTSSKTNPFLPTVLTTRLGLWPGAVVQLDDVFHDNIVTLGKRRDLVRVMELGALDLFSACRFHFGAKPRRRTDAGGWENIRAADMRMFLAGLFHRFGYSPRGTMLMSEHNTAKVSEDIARLLYDASGGMIRVDYQPIEGKQAALCGFWPGTEGGNFRAKACLESTHNLIHNDLAALPMQTGSPSSGLAAPVNTDRIVSYIVRVLRDVLEKAPHRADLLRLPTLDFHTQFYPFLLDYYQFGLNGRTDHQIEAWEALGHVVNEYTLAPGSGQYITEQLLLSLPQTTQLAIRDAARAAPDQWSRRRNLSPAEVWDRRGKFLTLPPVVLCDIIGPDLARECTARRGFIEFSDQEISCDPLVYQARYFSGPRAGREIPHGEKVLLYVLPFDDSTAIAVDAAHRFLGELKIYRRLCPVNPDAFGSSAPFESRPDIRSADLTRAAAEKHSRIADILEPSRILHAHDVQEARDLREHNRRVIAGEPVTTAEKRAHRRDLLRLSAVTAFGRAVASERGSVVPVDPSPSEDWASPAATDTPPSDPPPPVENW